MKTEQCDEISNRQLYKTLIVFAVIICFLVERTPCFAETVALSWDANSEPDLGGYKLYYKADSMSLPFDGTGAGEGGSPVDVHNLTTATVSGLDPSRTYYFAVTAYNTTGLESAYSNIVTVPKTVPPAVSPGATPNDALAGGTVPLVGSAGQTNRVAATPVQDAIAPVVSLTAPGNNSSVSGIVAITATATDNVGVSMVEFYRNGALLFASNVAPYKFNWNSASVADGGCTLMATAYDSAGNIKQSAGVSVTVNNAIPDITAPIVSSFRLPTTAAALTVPVSGFSASDSAGVTGYLITQSAAAPAASASGWSPSPPASFTFSSAGTKTAYAWAKDAAGNVSGSRAATTTITLADTTAPVLGSFSLAATAASLTVPVFRLSASDSIGVTGYLITASAAAPAATASGWSATAPASFTFASAGTKTAYAWAKDAAGNVSGSRAATTTIILSDTNSLTLTDALLALQIGTGKVAPTAGQMTRLDVAPVVNGMSVPDGVINTGDAIVLLSKIVGKLIM